MLTLNQLKLIMPAAKAPERFYAPIMKYAPQYDINTVNRMAGFLATLAVESGQFQWMHEIWGNTPDQMGYEPPSAKATQLGNIHKGDGYKYRGEGPIQITGLANFTALQNETSIRCVDNPEIVAQPDEGIHAACWFFKKHGCNTACDLADWRMVRRHVNGGYNGWDAFIAYTNVALHILLKPDFSNVVGGVN